MLTATQEGRPTPCCGEDGVALQPREGSSMVTRPTEVGRTWFQ